MSKQQYSNNVNKAQQLEKGGDIDGALRALIEAGAIDSGILLLTRHNRHVEAARLLLQSMGVPLQALPRLSKEHQQQALRAAHLLQQGGEWGRAAEVFLLLNQKERVEQLFQQVLAPFSKIEKRGSRYRQACHRLIQVSVALNRVSFEFDHALSHYIQTGPKSQAEQDAFYQLGLLYFRNDFPEMACQVLRQLRAVAPSFRNVSAVIEQIEDDIQDSLSSYEKIVQEEERFRGSPNRAVPRKTPAPSSPLPELPELPGLPELPTQPSRPTPRVVAKSRLQQEQQTPAPSSFSIRPERPGVSPKRDLFPRLTARLNRPTIRQMEAIREPELESVVGVALGNRERDGSGGLLQDKPIERKLPVEIEIDLDDIEIDLDVIDDAFEDKQASIPTQNLERQTPTLVDMDSVDMSSIGSFEVEGSIETVVGVALNEEPEYPDPFEYSSTPEPLELHTTALSKDTSPNPTLAPQTETHATLPRQHVETRAIHLDGLEPSPVDFESMIAPMDSGEPEDWITDFPESMATESGPIPELPDVAYESSYPPGFDDDPLEDFPDQPLLFASYENLSSAEVEEAQAGFQPGAIIGERYKIINQIGQGGMAAVFRAHDMKLDEDVALKVFDPLFANEDTVTRFKQELKLSRKLSHPNIIRLHDIGSHEKYHYISMELLTGTDLQQVLADYGALDIPFGLDVLLQMCEGIQAAHNLGVIHRDIKPSNFFLTDDGAVKVMDFGIATQQASPKLTVTGTVLGTALYMAPERALGVEEITTSSDLYSIGVVAYEMFTGRLPFVHEEIIPLLMKHVHDDPPPPSDFNPQIPRMLDRLIVQLLEKKPENRPSSCKILIRILSRVQELYA